MGNSSVVTLVIIAITAITSFRAFSDQGLSYKLLFRPVEIKNNKEWYRFFTSGFIHADMGHLLINMFVFYSFGSNLEMYFKSIFGAIGTVYYLALYILAIPAASAYSFFKHQNDYGYSALGASGAVSAVLFANVLIDPTGEWRLYGIIPITAIIAASLYLLYSHVMAKRNMDNVGHDAHFYGAVFGFAFTIMLKPALLPRFIEILLNWLPL